MERARRKYKRLQHLCVGSALFLQFCSHWVCSCYRVRLLATSLFWSCFVFAISFALGLHLLPFSLIFIDLFSWFFQIFLLIFFGFLPMDFYLGGACPAQIEAHLQTRPCQPSKIKKTATFGRHFRDKWAHWGAKGAPRGRQGGTRGASKSSFLG